MSHNPPSDGKTTPSSGQGEAYEVGYGKPPRWGQFKPGHSGNPKGRKKREDTIAGALRAELAATQKVRENGKEKTLTKGEILVKQWSARLWKESRQPSSRLRNSNPSSWPRPSRQRPGLGLHNQAAATSPRLTCP